MKTFHLTVSKVAENLFDGDVISVTLPGKEGVFQVLADHEAFVSELANGIVKIVAADSQTHTVVIPETGIAEVSLNQATVLL